MKHFLALLTVLSITATSAAKTPKNIVLILADDLGWADTTLYGKTSLYETPNIERLAARGMTFSSAYSSPICSPTRAAIMTGQNPARHGMTAPAAHLEDVRFKPVANTSGPAHQKCTNVKSSTRLDPAIPTLGKLLKDAGYATAHFGKWHLGREPHSPLELGFDVDLPHWHGPGPKTSYLAPWGYENPDFKEGKPGEHIEDRMAREAVAWLKQRDRKKPFFMNYWQFSVHAPFGAKPELIDRYRKKIKRGEKQQSPTYAAMVHSLDDAVGSLLDALEEEGIADDTVIIFYSDNGGNIHCGLEETDAKGEKYIAAITSNHPLRGGKGGIHEGGVRVPAVVVWPGVTEPGSRSDVRIQANDLYPTILRMLDIERPKKHVIDGVDFARALRGEDFDRGPMFTHVPGHGNTPQWLPPSTSVHDGDWKMIRTYHYGEDGAHQYRLYNLREDIGENHNLASAHPDKVKAMDRLIEDYIAEANVVVPQRNQNFDPAKFDPTKIGVQAGGLKMPKGFKKPGQAAAKPTKVVNQAFMLGWSGRGCDVSVASGSLQIAPKGRQPFLANAKVRAEGPVELRMRIRTKSDGNARLQWRTEGQDLFPKTGQTKSFAVSAGDWQELEVSLPVEGRLIHLRFFPPVKQRTEIDWIEIKGAQRWDFVAAAKPQPPIKTRTKTRTTARAVGSQPNVLFISIDDLNDWIGCMDGHPQAKTPNLDRLAKRGTLFLNAHCQSPLCNPSRTSVMLGLRPTTTGVYSLQPAFRTIPKYKNYVSLPQAFQASGYATSVCGKMYHGRVPVDAEFETIGRPRKRTKGRPKKRFVDPSVSRLDWGPWPPEDSDQRDYQNASWAIDQLKDMPKGKPFFMAVGFAKPHVPLYASQKWFDLYPLESIVLPPTQKNDRADTPRFSWNIHWKLPEPRLKAVEEGGEWKNKVRAYLACISFMDAQVGRILDALDASGHADNTVVVCWSDHGYHLGEKEITGKNTLWDPSTRVPLIFAGPGIAKGGRCERPAELLDLYPTLADLCHLKSAPTGLEGQSLVPLLKNANAPRNRPAITSHGPGNDSVRTETHRYIRYADGSEELYDIRKDPEEFTNLASKKGTSSLKQKLAAFLPKNPAKPVPGSNARLVELKDDGFVYWQNERIEKGAKIPEYE